MIGRVSRKTTAANETHADESYFASRQSETGAPKTGSAIEHPVDLGSSSATHFEIPPQALKTVAVAAPDEARSYARGSTVQVAEVAFREMRPQNGQPKRNAARSRRDRVPASRTSCKRAGRYAIRPGEHCSAVASDVDSFAGASDEDCTPVTSQNGRCAAARDAEETVTAKTVAASDDVHEQSAAGTTSTDEGRAGRALRGRKSTRPQGTRAKNRKACADAALSRQRKATVRRATPNASGQKTTVDLEALKVPTHSAALVDGVAYVRAVAMHVDLVGASARLVVSQDEKVSKAELDRLRELIFGKGGPASSEEGLRIDWEGIPRPGRERKQPE
jgi:hypothetical protein